MSTFSKGVLLFVLNWLDAQLTIMWVRGGVATEGNGLMAYLLEHGNAPFLVAKLTIGALVAYTFCRFSHLSLARRGLHFALCMYLTLMLVHAATGASALGWQPPEALASLLHIPERLLAHIS
jgi:Domain of unknown function (DUF5658)